MTSKFVEVPLAQTKKTLQQFENAIGVIAVARIQANLTDVSFETECDRVERCIETQYKISHSDVDFNEYGINFIMEHFKDLVFHSYYSGTYLRDVQDVKYKDDMSKEDF